MRRRKIVKSISLFLTVGGVALLVGTMGTCDYYDAVNQYYPMSYLIKNVALSFLLIGQGLVILG